MAWAGLPTTRDDHARRRGAHFGVACGALLALAVALSASCALDSGGIEPTAQAFNFPTALALSPQDCGGASCFLYVANSNFNLRFNAGTLQAFDLTKLHADIDSCSPGLDGCQFPALSPYILARGEVRIGSFATGIAMRGDGRRLYVPLESDGRLDFIDIGPSGELFCGGSGSMPHCDDDHRRGGTPYGEGRGVPLAKDPVAVVTGDLSRMGGPTDVGSYVMVGYRSGAISLFLDPATPETAGPSMVHAANGFPPGLSGLTFDAQTQLVFAPSSTTNAIARAGVRLEAGNGDFRPSYVYDAGPLLLSGLDGGNDTRSIAFDPRPGSRRMYVLSRRPEAVLFADADRTKLTSNDPLLVSNILEVGRGPSRLLFAFLGDDSRPFLFVSCFDSRDLYVIDVTFERVAAVVRGFSGPFELAVDRVRGAVYVADFRSSVVHVIDVRPLLTGQNPVLAATLGVPRPVQELK